MPTLTIKHKKWLFLIFIILTIIPFHWRSFFMGPAAIHLWAAADWYALALGFLDNGMDFFHPQVNQLNLQFPGALPIEELNGITAVDFPINPYIVAWIMKLLNTTTPMIYRGYTLLLSLAGLFYLFKAVEIRTNHFAWPVLIVSMVRFQPSFAYYMDGFMPTQNALSIFFIGLFFFFKYISSARILYLILAMVFFTLAGLIRLPFVIPMIALLGAYGIISIHQNKIHWAELLSNLLGLAVIMGYFLYNHSLASTYGSVFLNEIMPIRNVNDFIFYWVGGIARNSQSVFPITYVLLAVLVVWMTYKSLQISKVAKADKAYIFYIGIHFFGVLLYSVLMGRQLWAHDYYFNDFFFPAFIIALIWSLKFVEIPAVYRNVLVGFMVAASFQGALLWQKYAYNVGYSERPTVKSMSNFKDADAFLDEQNVPEDAVLLIIGSYAPSIPGNTTHRKCFGVRVPKTKDIETALSWPYDYIVTQNEFYDDVVKAYPDWEKVTRPIANNGKLTMHTLQSRK